MNLTGQFFLTPISRNLLQLLDKFAENVISHGALAEAEIKLGLAACLPSSADFILAERMVRAWSPHSLPKPNVELTLGLKVSCIQQAMRSVPGFLQISVRNAG